MIHFMLYTTGKQTIAFQPVLIAIEIVVIDKILSGRATSPRICGNDKHPSS